MNPQERFDAIHRQRLAEIDAKIAEIPPKITALFEREASLRCEAAKFVGQNLEMVHVSNLVAEANRAARDRQVLEDQLAAMRAAREGVRQCNTPELRALADLAFAWLASERHTRISAARATVAANLARIATADTMQAWRALADELTTAGAVPDAIEREVLAALFPPAEAA